jgi:tellurite resistance protein TehA-like permease
MSGGYAGTVAASLSGESKTFDALMLGSGAFWTLTYVLMIRRGFLDKTYSMRSSRCAIMSLGSSSFPFSTRTGPYNVP